ncbi:DUF3054 domain-containing protein [Microbacterium karelineae]|uniref:DUF3054 domain-containing protein n=1 Tax=Microbacterium karelineae TaxID=2654283 RepID=UPI001E65C44A|nr:DUF3054 domain-containing protein [Microbacterium karelineae]
MTSRRPFPWILAAVIDALLIVVFAAIGMANHEGGFTPAGLAGVAWPFLLGAAIGWAACRAWRTPAAPLRTGIPVWILAVALGMVLRVATGGGFAWSFLIVTALALGAFLVGWRAIAALAARIRRRGA